MPRYMRALDVLPEPIPVSSWVPSLVGPTLPPILGDHEIERDITLPSFAEVTQSIYLNWYLEPRPPPRTPDFKPLDVPVTHQTTVQIQLPVTSSTLGLKLAGDSVPLWQPGSFQLVHLSPRWFFMSPPRFPLGCRVASPLDSFLLSLNVAWQLPSAIWFSLRPNALEGSGIPLNLKTYWLQPWDGAENRCFEDCEFESIVVHLYWVGYPDIVFPLEINVHENGGSITTFQLATLLLERTQDWFNFLVESTEICVDTPSEPDFAFLKNSSRGRRRGLKDYEVSLRTSPASLEHPQESWTPVHCQNTSRYAIFVSDLPLELVLQIFSLLPCRSVIQLVLSQKALYDTFIHDESLYKYLCSRYGLCSLSSFRSSRTYRSIYVEILHKYGPLIGHWANDCPFRGNVMEFRVVDYNHVGWEGIICEVWKFPRPRLVQVLGAEDRGLTRPPDFYESFRIEMQPPPSTDNALDIEPYGHSGQGGGGDRSYIPYRPPKLTWFVHIENMDWKHYAGDRPSLHVLGPTTQSFYIHEHGTHLRDYDVIRDLPKPSLHPEIPLSVWYDESRGLPSLPQENFPLYDHSFLADKYSNGVFLFGAPSRTNLVKPPALSIFSPRALSDKLSLHIPRFVGVGDTRTVDRSPRGDIIFSRNKAERFYPRYYPLVFPRVPHGLLEIHPNEHAWVPESLVGIWHAAYEIYGPEVLFLEWDETAKEVKAWKVTGDIGVPRGALSWSFQIDMKVELDWHSLGVFSLLGAIPPETRAYRGTGVIGGRGFIHNQRDTRPITVAIVGTHEMRIRWGDVQHSMQCKRFKPRDHSSEYSIRGAGVLRGPWSTS